MTDQKPFFIGIDSDGCVFDAMDIKHKECFCPAFIKHFGLQAAYRPAREVWEFVNLYSSRRGTNRFQAVVLALEMLAEHPLVRAKNLEIPRCPGLRDWVARERRLGGPALEQAVADSQDPDLIRTLAWHQEVNSRVAEMVHGMPPFAGVREVLRQAGERAELMVVSQASGDALQREWGEHGLLDLVDRVAGQEDGTKSEHIAAALNGREARALMIGDAPGDRQAAQDNGIAFFPIIPGQEEASWARLLTEGLARLFEDRFDTAYQQLLDEEFLQALPEDPPWAGR